MAISSKKNAERLQAPSKSVLVDRVDHVVTDLARKVSHIKKLKKAPMLNAVIAWFLEQPIDDQVRIVNHGLQLYAAIPGDDVSGGASVEQPRGIEAEPIPPRRKQAQKRKHA